MSRSGYTDDDDDGTAQLYLANVARAIKGKRGQAFLSELAVALDAMPEKALICEELITEEGDCCTLGVVCKRRGVDVSKIDPEEPEGVGKALGITRMLAAEIAYQNDEGNWQSETDEQRWQRMRKWVASHLVATELSESKV